MNLILSTPSTLKTRTKILPVTEKSLSIAKKKLVINNNEILNINNKIYCFLVFSKEGLCALEAQQVKLFTTEDQYHKFKLLLKNLCHHFFKNNKKYENFTFETLILEKFKVTILLKQSIALIGIFPLLLIIKEIQ